MQCRDVRELADSFLSGQLLVETNHEVNRHLEGCAQCRAEIASRRALRDGLRTAWERDQSLQPRPDFAAELASRLRHEATTVSRRQMLRTWGAVAATLLVGTGGAIYFRGSRSRSALAPLAQAAAGDHQNCAIRFNLDEKPIPLEEAGRRFGGPYSALGRFALPDLRGAARLIDRHSCVYGGHRFAHVVFTLDDVVLSLLVTTDGAPEAIALESLGDGHDVAVLPAGRYLGFVVGDADATRLLDVAHALADPLSRQLS
jgi:hypothetical protein